MLGRRRRGRRPAPRGQRFMVASSQQARTYALVVLRGRRLHVACWSDALELKQHWAAGSSTDMATFSLYTHFFVAFVITARVVPDPGSSTAPATEHLLVAGRSSASDAPALSFTAARDIGQFPDRATSASAEVEGTMEERVEENILLIGPSPRRGAHLLLWRPPADASRATAHSSSAGRLSRSSLRSLCSS